MSASVAALTIAGSDSGGGAGIQVDLRTMQRTGVFATTAIAAVTAQNLDRVVSVQPVDPEVLAHQIEAVFAGFPIRAVKTGMLWSEALIETTRRQLETQAVPVVVDPVMVATSGSRLLDAGAVEAMRRLVASATVVTPNLDEATVLLGRPVDRAHPLDEARALGQRLRCAVLLKGGHLDGDPIDVLATEDRVEGWTHRRIEGANTHGTGCMLSAAIAARLALGVPLRDACAASIAFVHDALRRGAAGHGVGRLAAVESATSDLSVLLPWPPEP